MKGNFLASDKNIPLASDSSTPLANNNFLFMANANLFSTKPPRTRGNRNSASRQAAKQKRKLTKSFRSKKFSFTSESPEEIQTAITKSVLEKSTRNTKSSNTTDAGPEVKKEQKVNKADIKKKEKPVESNGKQKQNVEVKKKDAGEFPIDPTIPAEGELIKTEAELLSESIDPETIIEFDGEFDEPSFKFLIQKYSNHYQILDPDEENVSIEFSEDDDFIPEDKEKMEEWLKSQEVDRQIKTEAVARDREDEKIYKKDLKQFLKDKDNFLMVNEDDNKLYGLAEAPDLEEYRVLRRAYPQLKQQVENEIEEFKLREVSSDSTEDLTNEWNSIEWDDAVKSEDYVLPRFFPPPKAVDRPDYGIDPDDDEKDIIESETEYDNSNNDDNNNDDDGKNEDDRNDDGKIDENKTVQYKGKDNDKLNGK